MLAMGVSANDLHSLESGLPAGHFSFATAIAPEAQHSPQNQAASLWARTKLSVYRMRSDLWRHCCALGPARVRDLRLTRVIGQVVREDARSGPQVGHFLLSDIV